MATKVLRELDELSLAGMVRRLRDSRDLAEPEPGVWTGDVSAAVHTLAIVARNRLCTDILLRTDWTYLAIVPEALDAARVIIIAAGLGNDRPADSFVVEGGSWTP